MRPATGAIVPPSIEDVAKGILTPLEADRLFDFGSMPSIGVVPVYHRLKTERAGDRLDDRHWAYEVTASILYYEARPDCKASKNWLATLLPPLRHFMPFPGDGERSVAELKFLLAYSRPLRIAVAFAEAAFRADQDEPLDYYDAVVHALLACFAAMRKGSPEELRAADICRRGLKHLRRKRDVSPGEPVPSPTKH
jgi:hypothetical protein